MIVDFVEPSLIEMSETACRETVTVNLADGLHLRPFSMIAESARSFAGAVHILKDSRSVDAKNMLDLMTLEAHQGATLILEAVGEGASEVIEQLVRMFETDFKEIEQSPEC